MRRLTHLGDAWAMVGAGLLVLVLGDALGHPLALVPLPDPFSFPSGHAAAVTAIATTASVAYPWATPIAVPLAGLVSYSRVALRVHHASDVLAGVALGMGGAIATTALL